MISKERRSEITLSNIDTNDCAVIAFQAITGINRLESERIMKRDGGYKPGEGTPRSGMPAALKGAGYRLRAVGLSWGDTPATFSLRHEYGKFLIYIDGHVMALVDGDLHNSRSFWSAPVEEAFEVESD